MSLYKLRLSPSARADLKEIRAYSVKTHGRKTANAYDALIRQAFNDLKNDPCRPGARERPEITKGARSYHISLSRERAGSKIKHPRHIIFYFLFKGDELVVSRILHDARDLARHLPEEHRRVMRQTRTSKKKKPSRNKGRER